MEGSRDQLAGEPKTIMANSSMLSTQNESRIYTVSSRRQHRSSGKNTPATRGEPIDSGLVMEELEAIGRLNETCPLWGQSSSTWRHGSPRYSFSKDPRFNTPKASHLDIQKLELPSTLRSKSCTFGKGNKKPISTIVLRNAKLNPSPDRYAIDSYLQETRQPIKGRSFGLPWSCYKRVYIKHRKDAYQDHFTQDNPPAIYEVRQKIGKQKKAFSIYGRLKMFTQHMADLTRMNPGAVHQINNILVKNTAGMNQRSFGFGERIDLAKPANDYPAPSTYKIRGAYDRLRVK